MPLAAFRATCLCPNWSFRISCKLRCLFSASVRPADLVWIEYADNKVPLQVAWLRDSESHQLIQAAVHLLKGDPLSMGKVLTTGAGSIECEASISFAVSPNRLKTRPDGLASEIEL
jgi:hypothetical protein